MKRATFKVSELAEFLGVAPGTVYDAIARGEVPAVRVGRRLLIPRAFVARLLAEGPDGSSDGQE